MSFSLRVPLTLPVLKINSKTDRIADVLCYLGTLRSTSPDAELHGMVAVLQAGVKKL